MMAVESEVFLLPLEEALIFPLPMESIVQERIREICSQVKDAVDIAIELCLYCMKTQVFTDGNKRASIIFANHFLLAHGMGFIVIPENEVAEFEKLLVSYYESESIEILKQFIKERCWKTF